MLTSILDTDLYKLTMQQAVCMLYPEAQARYQFFNRGGTEFSAGFAYELRHALNDLRPLALTMEEKAFLKEKCYYLNPVYIDFLSGFRYDPNEVVILQDGPKLEVFVEGPWYRTILWEVPLMSIISEIYFRRNRPIGLIPEPRLGDVNNEKAVRLKKGGASFAEFGTRRRYSYENQRRVIKDLHSGVPNFKGTSNPHFAMMYDLTAVGTQAHEWFMFHGAQFGYLMANDIAQKKWVQVFQGDLGIALSDTFTTEAFFRAFNRKYAKLFDGVRHDSGNPFKFAAKVIKHYERLGIDPTTKTIVFSDGLNVDKALEIHERIEGKIRDAYGIGTHLTNDVGATPLNIVIKMTDCRLNNTRDWTPTIKLSDSEGKHTGDEDAIRLCKETLRV